MVLTTLFPNDDTNLKALEREAAVQEATRKAAEAAKAAEEAQKKAAEAARLDASIRDRNNLNINLHDVPLMILSKKGTTAIDWGFVQNKLKENEKAYCSVYGFRMMPANSYQRFRLIKSTPNNPTAPWGIRTDGKGPGDAKGPTWMEERPGYVTHHIEVQSCWYICMEDNGFCRIQHKGSGNYIELASDVGDDNKSTEITIQPRKDGNDKDKQLWKLSLWIDGPFMTDHGYLDKETHKKRAVILPISGDKAVDGGGQGTAARLYCRDYAGAYNEFQFATFTKKDPAQADGGPWYIEFDKTELGPVSAKSDNDEAVCRPVAEGTSLNDVTENKLFQWVIHRTKSGAYRFHNVGTGKMMQQTDDNPPWIVMKPFDPLESKQVFAIIRFQFDSNKDPAKMVHKPPTLTRPA